MQTSNLPRFKNPIDITVVRETPTESKLSTKPLVIWGTARACAPRDGELQ